MRRKILALIGIMIIVAFMGGAFTYLFAGKNVREKQDKLTVVTSFYPMYIAAENVLWDMDNIELINLTENHSGCLHDYQLTTNDMKKLESADIFIMNGGGMESFAEEVIRAYPDIKVVDTGKEAVFLEGKEHAHEDSHEHEEEKNAHIWLDTSNYKKQIKAIEQAVEAAIPSQKSKIRENSEDYLRKIEKLEEKIKQTGEKLKDKKVVVFHEGFVYLAKQMGLFVVHAANLDADTVLSTGEAGEIVDEIKAWKVNALFCEEEFFSLVSSGIGKESGGKVYVLDALTNGDKSKDSYIEGMEKNIKTLEEALERV